MEKPVERCATAEEAVFNADGTMTYLAIPYPLPAAWAKRLKAYADPMMLARKLGMKESKDEVRMLDMTIRMLAQSTGQRVTRPWIKPIAVPDVVLR